MKGDERNSAEFCACYQKQSPFFDIVTSYKFTNKGDISKSNSRGYKLSSKNTFLGLNTHNRMITF